MLNILSDSDLLLIVLVIFGAYGHFTTIQTEWIKMLPEYIGHINWFLRSNRILKYDFSTKHAKSNFAIVTGQVLTSYLIIFSKYLITTNAKLELL